MSTVLKKKSNLHYTRGITLKRVTSVASISATIAPGQRDFKETAQRWRAFDDSVSDLTGPVIEPQTSHPDSDVFSL